jgi:hypothetical protein
MILTLFDTVKRSAHMSVAHSSRAHMSKTIKKDGSSWHRSSSVRTAPPPCHLVFVGDASICLRAGYPAPPGLHRCHLPLPPHRRSRATWSLPIAPSSASASAIPRRQTPSSMAPHSPHPAFILDLLHRTRARTTHAVQRWIGDRGEL